MRDAERDPLPSDRSFGLTFAGVFAVIGAWSAWKGRPHYPAALVVAALFLVAAFAVPRLLHPLNAAWMRLAQLLNRVVSPIVMGVMYFAVLTPVATVMRLRGRDILYRRFDRGLDSYWIRRDPPGPDGSSFPRQF